MRIANLHDWNLTSQEGRILQRELALSIQLQPVPENPRLVAGADVAFNRNENLFFASIILLSYPDLKVIEETSAHHRSTFPYVPGLLSFREGPVLLKAFEKLRNTPDVVLFDGQGLAHPRRFGLACHLGLWLGLPSIGCAKSRLVGTHLEPAAEQGGSTPLMDHEEKIGEVLRTKTGIKPLYISPGHLADFESSARLVLSCCTRYRLPEPTRLADIRVGQIKRSFCQKH